MARYSRVWIFFIVFLFSGNLFSQDSSVTFSFSKDRVNDKELLLKIKAKLAPGIELFGIQKSTEDPLYSNVAFDSAVSNRLTGSIFSNLNEHDEFDSAVGGQVHYYKDSAVWQQKINASAVDSFLIQGNVSYMYKNGDQYLPAEKILPF